MRAVDGVDRPLHARQEGLEDRAVAEQDAGDARAAALHASLDLRTEQRDLRLGDTRHGGPQGANEVHGQIGADETGQVADEAKDVHVRCHEPTSSRLRIRKPPGTVQPEHVRWGDSGRGRELVQGQPWPGLDELPERAQHETADTRRSGQLIDTEAAVDHSLQERALLGGVRGRGIVETRDGQSIELRVGHVSGHAPMAIDKVRARHASR